MGKTSHIHSHEKSKVRECGYPQPNVDPFFPARLYLSCLMMGRAQKYEPWSSAEARALNVGLRLGLGFDPSEKVNPEP